MRTAGALALLVLPVLGSVVGYELSCSGEGHVARPTARRAAVVPSIDLSGGVSVNVSAKF